MHEQIFSPLHFYDTLFPCYHSNTSTAIFAMATITRVIQAVIQVHLINITVWIERNREREGSWYWRISVYFRSFLLRLSRFRGMTSHCSLHSFTSPCVLMILLKTLTLVFIIQNILPCHHEIFIFLTLYLFLLNENVWPSLSTSIEIVHI